MQTKLKMHKNWHNVNSKVQLARDSQEDAGHMPQSQHSQSPQIADGVANADTRNSAMQ